jgi:hypothetical protein
MQNQDTDSDPKTVQIYKKYESFFIFPFLSGSARLALLILNTVHDGEEIAGMVLVDENMKRAQKRDAVLNQKFYWR